MMLGRAKHIVVEHFKEEVNDVAPAMDPIVKDYMCRILVDFVETRNLCQGPDGLILAKLYQRALEMDPASRFEAFRHLGDVSIFIGGFFRDSVSSRRSLVGQQYYIDMGGMGYAQASHLTRSAQLSRLFSSLSSQVRPMMDAVCAISYRASICTDPRRPKFH